MKVTRLIGTVACGLALSSCASWMPSFDMFASKPTTAMLSIESDPPGAEARTSLGTTCRTPCTQQVPLTADITVNYALNGYTPQALTVHPAPPDAGATALLDPNPVFAQLQPSAPPPKPPPKKRRPKPPPPPGGPPPQQSPNAFPPPPTGTFGPPPTTPR
jgi:hypothetical protein